LLLILAALTIAAPLWAEEINAPESQWHNTATAETSAVNSMQASGDTRDDAQNAVQKTAAKSQTESTQSAAVAEQKSPEQQKKASAEQQNQVDDQESHERVLGLAPMFTVVNDASKARPLSVREKWKLFYRQTYDPFQFVTTGFSSAISQARDEFPEYGQGMTGYAKRYGAGFADNSLGGFFGNFALPSLLHDDPRYFRKGSGTFMNRLMYSAGTTVIARHDDGSHHPNYSNVVGNLIGCAFGNLYYPQSDRGVGTTFERGFEVTAYGAIGGVFQEFWPDIHDKIFKKHKVADIK
jgi:hypothetical protein